MFAFNEYLLSIIINYCGGVALQAMTSLVLETIGTHSDVIIANVDMISAATILRHRKGML
jgi:mannitol-specific phosphotransferase system IIBC component